MPTQTESQTVTIASGETTSTAVIATREAAWGVLIPAAFTGTAISFLASPDGSTFGTVREYDPVANDGSTRVSSRSIAVDSYIDLPAELVSCKAFKIVSGSAEDAARTLIVVGKSP